MWLLVRAAGTDGDASIASIPHRALLGLQAVGSQLASLNAALILPLLACEALVQCSKALKWTAILRSAHPVRYLNALRGIVVGAAATHLVPLRLDEVLRAGVVSRREKIPAATVFGTVVLDRIIELGLLGLIVASLSLLTGELPPLFGKAVTLLGVGFVLALACCLGLLAWRKRVIALLPENRLGQKLSSALEGLAEGLGSIPRGRDFTLLLLGAIGEWGATILFYGLILSGAGLDSTAALSLLLAVGNTLSYALPNLPAALGVFELIQGGMIEAVAGLDPARAAALALSAHAVLMIPVTITGLIVGFFEWRHGTSTRPSPSPEC